MREYKFFKGYKERTLIERWEELLINYPSTPGTGIINWGTTTTNPAWIVNPGFIQYAPPPIYTIPDYSITTTPGTGTYTIPYSGTINTATGFSLTTSNPNGITYTTTGMGGTLTTSANTFYNQTIK
jgi:hypothetical protein